MAAPLLHDGRAPDEALAGLGVVEDGVLGVDPMLEVDVAGLGRCPMLFDRPAFLDVGIHADSFRWMAPR
jgi:hypothetical protein